jgi:ankyrin repeat protein
MKVPSIPKIQSSLILTALLVNVYAVQAQSLAEAVAGGDREQAMLLLESGAEPVDASLVDGSTALLYAAYQGDLELTKTLLNSGADPNINNRYGAFPLSEAAQLNAYEVVASLLEAGADPNKTNLEGETALMVASRSGAVATVKLLLAKGALIDSQEDWGGQTALMWASAQNQPEILRILLKAGANPDIQSTMRLWDRRTLNEPRPKDMNKGGFSALQYAARQGNSDCVAILAEAGANLNLTDPDRVSALNLALLNMHFDTARVLIEAGADINQWDLWGRAPLYNALDLSEVPSGGRPDIPSEDKLTGNDIARLLLEKGADPNMQLKGRPPYRNAIFDRGADNVLSTGATPLIRAARNANNRMVNLLLENGALVDLPNSRGHTPLMIVAGMDWPPDPTRGQYKTEEDSIETIDILLAYGADINALTKDPALPPSASYSDPERGAGLQPAIRGAPMIDRQNALHAAAKIGWVEIAKALIVRGIAQQVQDSSGRTPFDWAMGRYPAAFNQPPPQPILPMAILLQNECDKLLECTIPDPLSAEILEGEALTGL